MLLNCGVGEDSWESLGLQGDPTSPSERRSVLGVHWKDWCLNWTSNILATWCEELTHWKRPQCWERLNAGGKRDNRGWDGWMASPTRWTWVWVNSGAMDREACRAAIHGVVKSRTWLGDWTELKAKGNHFWIFIGRTGAEAEAWPPDLKNWLIRKDPDTGKDKAGREGEDRGWDGWMSSPTQWSLRKPSLSHLAILWNSAFRWVYLSFSPLPFTSLLFSTVCKTSSDNHFSFFHFFFLGIVLIPASCTMSRTSVHSSSGTLSIRSNPLKVFASSTV